MNVFHCHRLGYGCLIALTLLASQVFSLAAAPPVAPATNSTIRPLIVATKHAPPFAYTNETGQWTGLSIELWEALANDLDLEFEYRPLPLAEMLDQLEKGEIDAAVSALTLTADRENRMDFTYPYFRGGIAAATALERETLLWGLLKRIASLHFLGAVLALATVLAAAAVAVWLFERKANPEQFGGQPLEGFGSSFWWSAVTMTTVGYGDKAPQTFGGRVVALIWMFASIIIISSFTAAIASSLTASQVSVDLLRSKPIQTLKAAVVQNSTGHEFAQTSGMRLQAFTTIEQAIAATESGETQIVIYDQPLLRYYIRQNPETELETLPQLLVQESYAIGLPEDSRLRESLNQSLLETLRTGAWQELQRRYFGLD